MSIIVYKCDTCHRELEVVRNTRGTEIVDRCTITQGCRGHLYQTELHPDYIRASLPDPVVGLDDWVQRKVLYNHTQPTPRTVWTIVHNLGTNPTVSVFVDRPLPDDLFNREEILPMDKTLINSDTIQLTFERAWSGIAQLVARSSDPDIITPRTRNVDTTSDVKLLTNNGELTIATKTAAFPSERMGLEITYITRLNIPFTKLYEFDSSPSWKSPWGDYNRITIGGKNYTVRSTNIRITEMIEGSIQSGATFYFGNIIRNTDVETTISTTPNSMDVVVLLAGEQGTTSDKIFNKILDITTSSPTNNPFTQTQTGGDLFVNQSILEATYPPIQSAR